MQVYQVVIGFIDLGILWFVAKEYFESKECNKVLIEILNKQKRQKKRVSVDRIIKAATMENIDG